VFLFFLQTELLSSRGNMTTFDLSRFTEAQHAVADQVRKELEAGRKRTHWMWFIFPQLRGLGHSATAQHFGLTGLEEARAYIAHPVLGPRLIDDTAIVNRVDGKTAMQIFGSPDDLKFRSCMTLFAALQPEPFDAALRKYYDGTPDPRTTELLHAA
jgi:uncharacterized protein (DUF1810 family)